MVVSHILAEKCDTANANNPQSRETAMVNLQRIMFGANNPIAKSLQDPKKKEPTTDLFHNLPPKGTVNREWLDIATNKQPGPYNHELDDPEPSRKGKPSDDPQFGANDPNNSIPPNSGTSPLNNTDKNPDEKVIPENYDDFVDYDGNIQDPKWVDPYADDPGKKRRHKDKPREIFLKYPSDSGMSIVFLLLESHGISAKLMELKHLKRL